MKLKKLITFALGTACSLVFLSGCAAGFFEEEIHVVFMNEGEVVDAGVITQFKNYKTPTISSAYIPTDFRFLGWTTYEANELDYGNVAHFKTQYISAGRMIHYMEAKPHAVNSTATYHALIMHKDDIPHEYHYAVVAWYDKAANSGLNQGIMDTFTTNLKTYLSSEGVSDEDINTIIIRGYAGNVGPTTGQILYDDDVDLMLGWGSVSNITTTGSIPESMIRESVDYAIGTHARYIHRISDNAGGIKVLDYLKSDACKAFFAATEA